MQDGMPVKFARRLFGGRFIVVACAVVFLPLAACAQNFTRQSLHGHVPKAVAGFHLQPTSRLSATKHLNLAIGLPLRNQQALDSLLQQIYDPTSPNFRQYLTPEQFMEQFGPTEQDYQAVIAFAKANGLTVAATYGNRLLLDVSGPAASVEKTFNVTIRVYQHPTENRTFYAPDTEPSVDSTLPILDVSGLDNYRRPHPRNLIIKPSGNATVAVPKAGSGLGGLYFGNDFRAAYAPDVTLRGSGQTVGLVEFDGYYPTDITNYEGHAGFTNVPLQNVLLDGFSGTPTADSGAVAEVSLDIEMAIAMAPALAKVVVFEGNPNNFIPNDVLNNMAQSNSIKQLSCSWGWNGGPDATTENIFLQMAAQGQSFFNASGDSDAFTVGSGSVNGVDNPLVYGSPSSSPNITQVGGTKLTMTSGGGSYVSETVWNDRTPNPNGGDWGSSGGISSRYSIPSWQTNIDMTTNHGSTTLRNIPDVALTADDIYVYYNNGHRATVGGTSCAAPLWAGFTALVNEQAASAGRPVVGFINPAIYAIGKSANFTADFHDITTGDNTWSNSPANFYAVPGYDLCTGWGTPAGQSLIDALAGPLDPLGITPATGITISGPVGGPFNVVSQSYALTNVGITSLDWSIINTSSWLNVSPDSGALIPGGFSTVIASLTSTASNLVAGTYTTILVFTNTTVHTAQNLQFTLLTGQSVIQNGGFEAGNFTGWTLNGNGGVNFVDNGYYSGITPHSGTYFMALGEPTSPGYLSQTVPTLVGQEYLLSLWLNSPNNPGSGQQGGQTIPNEFSIVWDGTTLFDQVNMSIIGWTNLLFIVTPTTSSTVLQFGARNDPWYFGLDDVNVWPIPTPSFRSVTKVTNNAVALTWNSLTSLVYRVEYSTNLAGTNWTILSTNTATDFMLTVTNSTGTDPQRFYRIQWVH
jgi:subtilase family serine protease